MLRDPEGQASGWGCSRCGRPETRDPQAPEAERRHLRNCDRESNGAFALAAAPAATRCPWSQLTGGEETVIGWWRRWQRTGVWPFAGDGAEQPAWVVQAFDHLTHDDDERRRREEAQR